MRNTFFFNLLARITHAREHAREYNKVYFLSLSRPRLLVF